MALGPVGAPDEVAEDGHERSARVQGPVAGCGPRPVTPASVVNIPGQTAADTDAALENAGISSRAN